MGSPPAKVRAVSLSRKYKIIKDNEFVTLTVDCSVLAPFPDRIPRSKIEDKLAKKHLTSGSLVLYDVTSSYLEGTKCELGLYGYNRDKTDSSRWRGDLATRVLKKGKTQILYYYLFHTCVSATPLIAFLV